MPKKFEIRADFDKDTIVVYQAYNEKISSNAVKYNKFVEPFSFNRMTWIKPSFLWLMERSNYGQKSNQEYTLAIRIKRSGWEKALSQAVLTHPEKSIYKNAEVWKEDFEKAKVHVQWDPERSIRGAKLDYWTIQVGISRELIQIYNDEWILEITDYSSLVKKIYILCKEGKYDKAKEFLPKEKIYYLPEEINKKLGIV